MTQKTIAISFKDYLSEIYNQPSLIHEAYNLFHNYSYRNTVLAMAQLNEIEPINTYSGWKKIGRNVKKGSKAIALLMPVNYKIKKSGTENNDEEYVIGTKFIKKFHWFSLSQTEGEEFANIEIPEFDINKSLRTLGINQESFQIINGNCQGYAIPSLNVIAINPLAFAPFKILIHEVAHCLLHQNADKIIDGSSLENSLQEFEAETVAYLVCCSLGKFDHLEYSRGYIANWINKEDVKEENFKRAIETANIILKSGYKTNKDFSR